MDFDELKNTFSENELSYSRISASSLANIMKYVNVELLMDNRTLDYYYSINIDKLIDSNMPKEEIDELKKQGWSIDNNKSLILFLKN